MSTIQLENAIELEPLRIPRGAPLVIPLPLPRDGVRQDYPSAEPSLASHVSDLSSTRLVAILAVLTLHNLIASFTQGILTVSIPRIAKALSLSPNLIFWPSSVNALTCGSLLIVAGAVGDVLDPRAVWLTGCFLLGCFVLACSIARTGIELIIFRAFQGVGSSLCLTNSVSILTRHVPAGRTRNIAFGCLGLSQPLGLSIGLVLGGVLEDSLGWRAGWYLSAGGFMVLFIGGVFAIPTKRSHSTRSDILKRLREEVDWVGASIASTGLGLFSYVLAMITSDLSNIRKPANIVPFITSLLLAPTFVLWVRGREKNNKPALIPTTLWQSRSFTTLCVMLLTSFAVQDAMEILCSLYFQNVQLISALQSSLRLLPMCITGVLLNITTGLFIHRVSAIYLVLITSLTSAIAPLLMALTNPHWPYWYAEFPSQVLMPLSVDVLYTIGILVTSEIFPENTQALASGVFNTVSQLGISIGLTLVGIISRTATRKSAYAMKNSPEALLVGYRAAFWAAFVWVVLACIVGVFGLRKIGKVGLKRE